MPSDLIVEVVEILEINNHPNADRLELVTVKGWQCVVQKDVFKACDKVVYLPIDSILPPELESKLFPPESTIKLHKSRIKTIKLRKAISQGLIITLEEAGLDSSTRVGTDVMDKLGITKYIVLAKGQPSIMKGKQRSKREHNPYFHKYTSINNIKNYPNALEQIGLPVVATEKIHGTSWRAGWVPFVPRTILQKIQHRMPAFVKKYWAQPEWDFVFGSHNVQLQNRRSKDRPEYYDTNVYLEAVKKYGIRSILNHGEVLYGEIYGHGIQSNYHYGCEENEHKMVVIDLLVDGKYLDHSELVDFVEAHEQLTMPPIVYIGPFITEEIEKASQGKSLLAPNHQPVREGCVVRPIKETQFYGGRAILKSINPKYLLSKNQSEWT